QPAGGQPPHAGEQVLVHFLGEEQGLGRAAEPLLHRGVDDLGRWREERALGGAGDELPDDHRAQEDRPAVEESVHPHHPVILSGVLQRRPRRCSASRASLIAQPMSPATSVLARTRSMRPAPVLASSTKLPSPLLPPARYSVLTTRLSAVAAAIRMPVSTNGAACGRDTVNITRPLPKPKERAVSTSRGSISSSA